MLPALSSQLAEEHISTNLPSLLSILLIKLLKLTITPLKALNFTNSIAQCELSVNKVLLTLVLT